MEITAGIVYLGILAGAVVLFVVAVLRKGRPGAVRRVDKYALSVEQHDGFHFVHLKLQTSDGSVDRYELDPTYGHVLSDELLQTAAIAIKESHGASR